MVIRFRYTTSDGAVVELYDLDGLMRHVVDGHVTDDTELFDALTQVTAPAEEQAAYQLVVELLPHRKHSEVDEEKALTDTASDDSSSDDPALPDTAASDENEDELRVPGLEVTLADVEAPESIEEVVRKMERARALEERSVSTHVDSPTISPFNEQLRSWEDDPPASVGEAPGQDAPDSSTEAVSGTVEDDIELTVRPRSKSRREAVRPSAMPDLAIPLWMLDSFVKSGGPELARLRREAVEREQVINRSVVRSPFVAAFAATVVVATVSLGMGETARHVPTRTRVVDTAPPPLDLVGVADRLAASGGIALDHMVDAMDSVAIHWKVKSVPRVWLEVDYFVDVGQHPQVRAHWVRYRDFADELRREEEALFRQGYVARLQELDVSTSVMSMRLASAVRVFQAGTEQRDSVYSNMERLADRAIALHDLLFDRQSSIRLDPGAEVGVARDPFLQFVTDEPELRLEILGHIDEILATLEALHGDTRWTRERLNAGILSSLGADKEMPLP